jgi:hypothetical protein
MLFVVSIQTLTKLSARRRGDEDNADLGCIGVLVPSNRTVAVTADAFDPLNGMTPVLRCHYRLRRVRKARSTSTTEPGAS